LTKRKLEIAIHVINVILISIFFSAYLNIDYPYIGHDYKYFIPNLLDNYLHYKINGFSIQWYTPSFGGGLPSFPNPQQIQFSLSELLTLLMNPWSATIVATICFALIGYFSMYYFLSHSLSLRWQTGILSGLFFTLNGFYIERMAVGHLGYQTFPVIVILMVTLFAPIIPKAIAGLVFSLVIAMLIHQAGFFLIAVFGLSFLIVLPMIYLFNSTLFSWKRVFFVTLFGGGLALIMSASKLAAVFAFMSFFPRQIADYYPNINILKGLSGIILQLLGTMNLAPLLKLVGKDPSLLGGMASITGANYGFWEFDMSLSPIVIGIIIIGFYRVLRKPKEYSKLFAGHKKWLAWSMLIFFIWLTIEFTLAKGFFYPTLQKLPIFSSLHVNPRFASAFLFPLALSAAIIYNGWVTKWSERKTVLLFLFVNLLTLISVSTFFMIKTDLQNRSYDVTKSLEIYRLIQSGDNLTVTGIVSDIDNTDALLMHQSNLQLYEPIFGYGLENFHPKIVPGSIWNVSDGYYNMTNPSGYVFPEINGTRPFERIPIGDKDKLEDFARHKQPGWKIPFYQQVLDWVSGLTVLVVVIILIYIGGKWMMTHLINNQPASLD
jgi:hypothetical protein